jgi:ABC-type Fe3+/spermidine/putrescine transport system ATPase subunit
MKRELLHLLRRLQEKYNLTVIMITHNMDDAYFLGDTLSVLIDGKIHQTDKRDTIYYRPATLEVARFMGIKNLFDVEIVTKEADQLLVECDSLDSNLVISHSTALHPLSPGQRFIAGIRAEDVMFLREDLKSKREENIIKGRVMDIFFKGSYYTVLFRPERRETIIEIDLPDYAFHKLALKKDQSAKISLRKERIFLIGSLSLNPLYFNYF